MKRLMLLAVITALSAHLIKADYKAAMEAQTKPVSTTPPTQQTRQMQSTTATPPSPADKWAAVREQLGIYRRPVTGSVSTKPPATMPTFSKMSTINLAWGGTATPKETRLAKDGSYYIYKLEDANQLSFVKHGKDGSQMQCRKDRTGFSCWIKASYGWDQVRYPRDPRSEFYRLNNGFGMAMPVK